MLASVAQVKETIGITSATEDALLLILLQGVDRALKDLLAQEIERGTYTEYQDGNNANTIRLRQRPIVPADITGVWVDPTGAYGLGPDAFASDKLLTVGTDYALKPDQPNGSSKAGLLVRVRGVWPGAIEHGSSGWGYGNGLLTGAIRSGRGNIKITYSAGYQAAQIPADLILTEILVLGRIRQMKRYGSAIASEGYEGYSYSLRPALNGLFSEFKHLWSRYRSLDLGG